MVHVPYKGAALSINDLLGGQVSCVIADLGSSRAYVGSGHQLRALATTGKQRAPLLPDVPTFTESGYPSLEPMVGWIGMWIAAGTPGAVIEKLTKEFGDALRSNDVRAFLQDLGWEATGTSGQAFNTLIAQESGRWKKVILDIGGISVD
jgi:tripartite-type tricarboxylate transporter receptor subunit TctC